MKMNVFELLIIKMVYLVAAVTVLWGLGQFMNRTRTRYYRNFWHFSNFFKVLNILLIIGYIVLILQLPVWMGRHFILSLPFILTDDIFAILLLAGYIFCFLRLSFHLQYPATIATYPFGSYLMQYGYIWLFILNILIFMRIDSYYLPLVTGSLSKFQQIIIEFIVFAVFMLLQLGVVNIRKIRMITAPPELQAMVMEVAACLKIRIKEVRIWKLDRIINAYSAGLLRHSIFLTEALIDSSDPQDLKMILAHECAHFKRHHLVRRALTILALVYLGTTLMDDYPRLPWPVYLAFSAVAFLTYQAIARRQELMADKLAGELLGGASRMADALERTFGCSSAPTRFGKISGLLLGHPDLATRLKRLRQS
jgi:Zn-dependent protease with chaperone function